MDKPLLHKRLVFSTELINGTFKNPCVNCPGVVPGYANAQPPGRDKIPNVPPPGLTTWVNAPRFPGGRMGTAGIDWCITRKKSVVSSSTNVRIASSRPLLTNCKHAVNNNLLVFSYKWCYLNTESLNINLKIFKTKKNFQQQPERKRRKINIVSYNILHFKF